MKHYDVIVVGGGHAGVEAALASARRGAKTALITFRKSDLGVMSCNPAIGGIGKGHLVREIDALGGLMGEAADYAGIQYRLLNRSRGPAVHGPRVQADRRLYTQFVQNHVGRMPGLMVIEAEVVDLKIDNGAVIGVATADNATLLSDAVVLTTGTFLRGEIHIGYERISGGRRGASSADRLGSRLREAARGIGRLKTGTPARLDAKSIDWGLVGTQLGDASPTMMSFMTRAVRARQIACGVTETNAHTHDIIRQNSHMSAMNSGNITGNGPRYCPSVEDKVARFGEKNSHIVYLEPEGLDDQTIYPNGVSTSLPREVQQQFLRSIKGLERVQILQFGYAIEYDYVDPRSLDCGLGFVDLPGLFLAGQINGTTGYEEAAAQGLLAGANAAARALDTLQVDLSREDSYIGVMVDDLVTRGVSEPYRMFTSRAEYRLSLRADNADQRLTPRGREIGLVEDRRWAEFDAKMSGLAATKHMLKARLAENGDFERFDLNLPRDGQRRDSYLFSGQLIAESRDLSAFAREIAGPEAELVIQAAIEAFYAPYVERQGKEAAMLRKEGDVEIPRNFDFAAIPSLSSELRVKLGHRRPRTMKEAWGIEGMTPAAIVVLLARLKLNNGPNRAEYF